MVATPGNMSISAPPSIQGIEIRPNQPVGKFTSFGAECRAHALVVANSQEGLSEFIRWAKMANEKYYILGGGTNCIFADPFYNGFIIKLGQAFRDVKIHNNLIRAGCSIPLSRLLNISISENLTGLEFTWDIPGTLGGAVAGNSGSANQAICDHIEAVKGIDEDGEMFIATRKGFEHRYRSCSLKGRLITEVVFRLKKENPEKIQENLQHFKDIRWIQPIGVKSSGCIFKNPSKEMPAGKIIDEAGLKGFQMGGVMISDNHANFMINKNKASVDDVKNMIEHVRQVIFEKHGIQMHTEVQFITSPKLDGN